MVNTTDYQHDYMEKVKKLNWLGKGKQLIRKFFQFRRKRITSFFYVLMP